MLATACPALGFGLATLIGLVAASLQEPQLEQWPYLLRYPAVLNELAVSDAQKQQVVGLLDRLEQGELDRPSVEKRIAEILKPGQSERWDEIRSQILLTRGALSPECVEELKPSDDQRKQLKKVLASNLEANRELLKRLAVENLRVPGARDKLKRKYYDPARKSLLGILTPDQKKELERRLGKEFPEAFNLAESF